MTPPDAVSAASRYAWVFKDCGAEVNEIPPKEDYGAGIANMSEGGEAQPKLTMVS